MYASPRSFGKRDGSRVLRAKMNESLMLKVAACDMFAFLLSIVLIACSVVDTDSVRKDHETYSYTTHPLRTVRTFLPPLNQTVIDVVESTACYYYKHKPDELMIGEEPKVNTVLQMFAVLIPVTCFVMTIYLYNNRH